MTALARPPDLVVPLVVPAKYRYGFPAMSLAVAIGCVAAIVLDVSLEALIWASVTLAIFAWIWGSMFAMRRARRGAARGLVLTRDGIRSPFFSLDWERVAGIRIGATSARTGSLPALFIAPIRREDVRLAKSAALRANRWIDDVTGHRELRVLQVNVEMPLEELASKMEARAGRPLRASGPDERLHARD